jgi:hypothetical protein
VPHLEKIRHPATLIAELDHIRPEYNGIRPHRSLDVQPPNPTRALTLVESSTVERPVRRIDVLGGLIHEYQRAA